MMAAMEKSVAAGLSERHSSAIGGPPPARHQRGSPCNNINATIALHQNHQRPYTTCEFVRICGRGGETTARYARHMAHHTRARRGIDILVGKHHLLTLRLLLSFACCGVLRRVRVLRPVRRFPRLSSQWVCGGRNASHVVHPHSERGGDAFKRKPRLRPAHEPTDARHWSAATRCTVRKCRSAFDAMRLPLSRPALLSLL